MNAYKCKSCNELVIDPSKHVCSGRFEKVEMPVAEICKINGHQIKTRKWINDWSAPSVIVDAWENDEGHHISCECKEMETKTCTICGYTETRVLRTYPNPRLK